MVDGRTSGEWADGHAEAVRRSAPEVPAFSQNERDAVWHRVSTTAPDPRPRHRWRATVVAVVAACAVGTAGAATAGLFGAHTGRVPTDAEDLELGGPGERLDPAAPDFAEVVDEVTSDIEFPSASSRARAVAWQVDDLSDSGALVSEGALRLWVSGNALCAWSNEWAAAAREEDTATLEAAARVIREARSWPAITDTDPDLAGDSEFSWLPALEQAVSDGDTDAARAPLHDHGACLPGLAPALGLGPR
ncbi:hypothetical protein [Nocardioides okcheonensis]|uniref:hypothetical protein n=1 Tax=Nocardioides okcheonensis TaxID=2894081 RepID=UPI001E51173C|nr:hypothetical protein [Nocardioides okcheonensis]UFN43550.1 hypothetical protein LN652_16080 [Nocardioides okcheonensis]